MKKNIIDKNTITNLVEDENQQTEFIETVDNYKMSSDFKQIKTKNLENIRNVTGKKIKDGLNKKTAGTGTPMAKLNGAAKFTSQLSNVGGGSKENGGGGMEEGFNTIVTFIYSNSRLQTIQENQNTQISADTEFLKIKKTNEQKELKNYDRT